VCYAFTAIAGCGQDGGTTTIATTFDPCDPPSLAVDATATPAQRDAIARAFALWELRDVPTLDASPATSLPIRFQGAAPEDHGLYDDRAAIIYVNDQIVDRTVLAIVIAHELGHAFGLVHVSQDVRSSVMNPGNLTVEPTTEDRHALESLWGTCPGGSATVRHLLLSGSDI
jgi:hypothetical protein